MMLKLTSISAAFLCMSIVSSALAGSPPCSTGCYDCEGNPHTWSECHWATAQALIEMDYYFLYGGRVVISFEGGGTFETTVLESTSVAGLQVSAITVYPEEVDIWEDAWSNSDHNYGPSGTWICFIGCGYAAVTDDWTLLSTGSLFAYDEGESHLGHYQYHEMGSGFAWADQTIRVEPITMSASQDIEQSSQDESTVTQHAAFMIPVTPSQLEINRTVVVLGESIAASVISTEVYTKATPNLTFVSGTPDYWTGSSETELTQGDHELSFLIQNFSDETYDVNDDGRFNVLDQEELVALAGPTTTETERWDFDDDYVIDQDDVDVLARLIDLQLDSGIFGDLNRDGEVDCEDRYIIANYADATLEDAGYHIELDFDLDGDNDSGDRNQFLIVSCPELLGDLNCDRSVDAFDVTPFTLAVLVDKSAYESAYPNCSYMLADINQDGYADAFDIDPFTNCYLTGSCPQDF